jgi:streptogramin lyase
VGLYDLSTFPVPPELIAAGSDGNVYVANGGGPNAIGQVSPDGVLTVTYPLPSPQTIVDGMVSGSDGAIWFTALCATCEDIDRLDIGTPGTGLPEALTALLVGPAVYIGTRRSKRRRPAAA